MYIYDRLKILCMLFSNYKYYSDTNASILIFTVSHAYININTRSLSAHIFCKFILNFHTLNILLWIFSVLIDE